MNWLKKHVWGKKDIWNTRNTTETAYYWCCVNNLPQHPLESSSIQSGVQSLQRHIFEVCNLTKLCSFAYFWDVLLGNTTRTKKYISDIVNLTISLANIPYSHTLLKLLAECVFILTLSGTIGRANHTPSYKKCHNYWKANGIELIFHEFS